MAQAKYWTYRSMGEALAAWQAAYPHLLRCRVIGKSSEGRELTVAILTDAAAGSDREKPAILVDANIHAGEVAGNAAAMYWIETILEGFQAGDPAMQALLDDHAVYVIPRIALDGAEAYLTTPKHYRSSPKIHPDAPPGWVEDDIDGNGHILTIRIESEDGAYAVDEERPQRMRRRRPGEMGGRYYHCLVEGRLDKTTDQTGERPARGWLRESRRHRLDFNRNFPVRWGGETLEPGAGRLPLSEPETAAVARFMVDHPNIAVYTALHTAGGVILRQPSTGEDQVLERGDRTLFREVAEMGADTTGYFARSNWQAFAQGDESVLMPGAADDFLYEHRGVLAFTVEIWDLPRAAGAKGYAEWGRRAMALMSTAEAEANARRIWDWIRTEVPESWFPWRPFDHPDLGRVEIGGVDFRFVRQNPPPSRLPLECERIANFLTRLGNTTARLRIEASGARALAPGRWRVWAEAVNVGYLPTAATGRGQTVGGTEVEAALEGEATLIAGQSPMKAGHLLGYGSVSVATLPAGQRAFSEWVVAAEPGTTLGVRFSAPRAGTARVQIVLEETDGLDGKG